MPQPPKLIGAVERALTILDLFTMSAPELGITEIAAATGLHKSTAAGLVHTLAIKGYLAQNPLTRKYRLGLKLVERAALVLGSLDFRQAALPCLRQLRDAFDETVNLALLDDGQVVYVECLPGTKALGMQSKIGQRGPFHSTALGKAIMAYYQPTEVAAHIAHYGLRRITAHTVTDPAVFHRQLAEVRRLGYALYDEENEHGGRCVAAPIFDHTGRPVAAISVSMPTLRLPLAEAAQVGARVREAAQAISASLGHVTP
jgi:DNA-binding IclR family transcriptional regulator